MHEYNFFALIFVINALKIVRLFLHFIIYFCFISYLNASVHLISNKKSKALLISFLYCIYVYCLVFTPLFLFFITKIRWKKDVISKIVISNKRFGENALRIIL